MKWHDYDIQKIAMKKAIFIFILSFYPKEGSYLIVVIGNIKVAIAGEAL